MIQRGVMAGVVVVLFSSCEPKPATCEPNPCTTDRQTTCEVEDGTAVCRCDPGYAPEGEGCSELPAWTCERQHPAGDFAEPDECPPLAHPLAAELPEAHTIEPAGDHDWYEVRVTAGRIVQFSAVSSSTPLLLEVFDERGLTLLASDARGVRDASVSFLAPRTAAVMIRVRALRGDAVGPYDASWRELGSDDFVNTPDEAITLTPAAGQFSGQIQYAGDIDVVRLEVPPLTAVWLSNRDAGGGHEIEIAQVDGGFRTIQTLESTLVTVPETESFVLRARALDGRRLGPFVLAMESRGPDDHSDEAAFATPLVVDGASTSVTHERANDVDSISVAQEMGKIYRATWSPSTSRFHTVRVVTASGAMVKMGSSTTGVTWRSPERPAVVQLQPSAGPIPMSFEFTVTDLGVDDQTAVAGKPIALGAPTEGRLEVSGDVDVFSFTATAGHVIGASLALPTGTTESLRVRLFDANQTQVAVGSTGGRGLATTTGTYTVRVEASLASGPTDLLPYVLTVSDEGLDDHVNAAGTNTTPLTFGAPSPGALQYAGDLDAFGFTPQPGHLYQFNCTRPLGTCTVKIRNADGQMVAPVGFASATGVFFANVSGVWTAEVADLTSPGLLGPFSLTITDRGPEDHGATIADATPVTVGAPIASELAFAGDVDAFAFAATAGHVYRVTASGTPTLTLDVRTSSDLPVAYQSDSNTLSAFAATDGTLYVLAKASFSTATPAFTLTIVDEGLDDHGNLPSAGTPLAAGASTTGRVQYWQDVDYFTLAVTPRRHYRLQCTSQTTRCSIVVDAGGTVVTSSQSTGIPTVSFTPPANVTSVSVRISLSQLATYEVLATELAADDHGDLPSEATPLALEGAAVTGTLGVSNDVDQFSVASTAGEVVILTCTSTSGVACAMTLRTSTGGSATATSAPAAQATLAALSTGAPVQVEVRSNGNATGTFDLSATRGSDDHTSPAPLSIGTPVTARIDYANDEDVFEVVLTTAQPVRLSVTGDTRAELFTPSGQYALTVSSSFGTVNYSPPATGTFTLRVKGASNSRPPGPYTITLQ